MAETPRGTRIYAIGDIHGQSDLLAPLIAAIIDDVDRDPPERPVLLYIGDYVDRGPGVREVVETLSNSIPSHIECVFLKGNHEAMMLDSMAGSTEKTAAWMANGGRETLACYGINVLGDDIIKHDVMEQSTLRVLGSALAKSMPQRDQDFFKSLNLYHQEGDYLFVHAGIRPGVALKDQSAQDLIWIRREFLDSRINHGVVVVHGHTPKSAPEVRKNRIGIDTGAYQTGILTCVVLDGAANRFIQSSADTGISTF